MSDAVAVAMIASMTSTVASVLAYMQSRNNSGKIDALHKRSDEIHTIVTKAASDRISDQK